MRGRKPKPTQLKRLEGNPGKRRLNGYEPLPPVPDLVPYAPRFLNEAARDEWNRMINILLGMGLYTQVDHAALAMYCQAWGRWIVAERKLAEEGEIITGAEGGKSQNPWRYEANKAQEQIRRMLAEFGLTPASRARLSVPAGQDEPSLADQLFSMANRVAKDGE